MHQRKILLLENVASQAAGVREHLSLAGYEVAVSRYEADGLRRLEQWRPDLVLVSTAHPAGDFVEYCRRVRALAPAVRIVVTASLVRERLFQEHPGLQAIVDGVLVRPYGHEEVAALLADDPGAPHAAASDPAAADDVGELRADFQRQLEAKFLEVEELKRNLEATARQGPAPGQVPAQEGTEELRRAMQEASKKSALALATELLKRSEIEVKLDNLLRMKEDFEFRAQNEIEERNQEIEELRGELRELREGADTASAGHAVLRDELERALIEKEQLEERLHAVESGSPPGAAPAADAPRTAALEEDLARCREQAAGAQVALAEATARVAVLEESSARALSDCEAAAGALARERELRAAVELRAQQDRELDREQTDARQQALRAELDQRLEAARDAAAGSGAALLAAQARLAELEKEAADVREARDDDARREQEGRAALEGRLAASEAARLSVAAEAEAAVEQVMARVSSLEAELGGERQARVEAERRGNQLESRVGEYERRDLEAAAVRERVEELGRELAAAGDRAREVAAERDRLNTALEQRESALAGEIRVWREKAELAVQELELLRAQKAERDAALETGLRGEREAREAAERQVAGLRDRIGELERQAAGAGEAERDRMSNLSREREGELAGEIRSWREKAEALSRELELARAQAGERADQDEGERLQLAQRLEQAVRELEGREREVASLRGELAAAGEAHARELSLLAERAAARAVPEAGAGAVPAELHRIQELLEEVISRARTDAVDHARREAELSVRLQSAVDERRLLQERFDRASDEAAERERRSATLLQSAIDRSPAPARERANLPAIVPPEPAPPDPARRPSRATALAAGAVAVVLLVALAVLALRGGYPPSGGERRPAPLRPKQSVSPEASGPREVWERWTRSDGSGGVLVQATLRSEEVLRAEVESEQRSRGWSAEEARAELARRLGTFHFDSTLYVTVHLKNFAPGYPDYLDDVAGRFRLRDSSGREVPAFLPPGHEKDRRVFSFGAGAPGDLIYEATVPLGFDRAGLSPSPGYLQLVASEVGAVSRRVLTWELE